MSLLCDLPMVVRWRVMRESGEQWINEDDKKWEAVRPDRRLGLAPNGMEKMVLRVCLVFEATCLTGRA